MKKLIQLTNSRNLDHLKIIFLFFKIVNWTDSSLVLLTVRDCNDCNDNLTFVIVWLWYSYQLINNVINYHIGCVRFGRLNAYSANAYEPFALGLNA